MITVVAEVSQKHSSIIGVDAGLVQFASVYTSICWIKGFTLYLHSVPCHHCFIFFPYLPSTNHVPTRASQKHTALITLFMSQARLHAYHGQKWIEDKDEIIVVSPLDSPGQASNLVQTRGVGPANQL